MLKRKSTPLDFEIDKLTNSIENTLTGESHPTSVLPITTEDLAKIKKDNTWQVDWNEEYKTPNNQVFKLTLENEPNIIQGLMCYEIMPDHIHIHLLESAEINKGKNKLYFGVPGNLVAYACKISFEEGFEGNVAFVSKTKLIEHYVKMLGAFAFGSKIIIMPSVAKNLVNKYYNT
jgi:hypothetical protein